MEKIINATPNVRQPKPPKSAPIGRIKHMFGKKMYGVKYKYRRCYGRWKLEELKERIDVICIGKRTLYNGTVEYSEDTGCYFQPDHDGHFDALLVVSDMLRKPFFTVIPN